MAISNIIERTVDIEAGVKQEDLHRLFAVADAQAHTFKITVTKNGEPQSLSGHTVIGYFMTHFYGTVVINGSVSDNIATLTLPAACYANNVGFQLIIRLVSGSTKTAVYWGSGYVSRSATSPTIDPGTVVPDLDDLLARLDQMDQATQAANTAADNANAAASKSVRYDTAQNLTDAQKAQAQSNIGFSTDITLTVQGAAADAKKTGDEITALKGDFDEITEYGADVRYVYTPIEFSILNTTETQNGLTKVQNSDGTIRIYGTATSNTFFMITDSNSNRLSFNLVRGETYRLTGCPANGGTETYRIDLRVYETGQVVAADVGNGALFTVNETKAYYPYIRVVSGVTLDEVFSLEVSTQTIVSDTLTAIDRTARNGLQKVSSSLVSRFYGKKVSIIGDSIDTFDASGYKIDGYRMYYPAIDITDVQQTWWKQVIDASGASLEINASWSGSRVTNTHSDATFPDFYDRVSVIGTPDIIFVTLGTNDSSNNVPLGEYDFETDYTSLSESTFRTAYIKGMKALQNLHPNALIIAITEKMNQTYQESIFHICSELNIIYIDASDYTGASGVHPGLVGMNQIARLVLFPTDTSLSQPHVAADANKVGDELSKTVKVAPQTLSEIQKAQVRDNIDAASKDDLINHGISESVKQALLLCFQSIPWLNDSNVYNNLYNALYQQYPVLQVSYDYSHSVYDTDSLDSLKDYLTVKYYESADDSGTTIASEDYSLSGELSEGSCIVLVSYLNTFASFSITVGTHILYSLQNGIFDGTSDSDINTGVTLFDVEKSYSIICKGVATLGETAAGQSMFFSRDNNGGFAACGEIGSAMTSIYTNTHNKRVEVGFPTGTGAGNYPFKIAFSHVAGESTYRASINWNGKTTTSRKEYAYEYVYGNKPLYIGCKYYLSDGEITDMFNNRFIGTMEEFKIYDYALTQTECDQYVA